MSRALLAGRVTGSLAAAAVALACNSSKVTSHFDAGSDGALGVGGGAETGGAGNAGGSAGGSNTGGGTADGSVSLAICGKGSVIDGGPASCGKYLVEHVDACGDCHTQHDSTGAPIVAWTLAGDPNFLDLSPADSTTGSVPAPNLTTLVSDGWTEGDIKDAILNGNRSQARGGGLFPVMPYQVFHNMEADDADAIAAYISSLPAIAHQIPARQPLPAPIDPAALPIQPVDATLIPPTTLLPSTQYYANAQRGRYYAAEVGVCMDCHTERTQTGALDSAKFFAGGFTFPLGPPFGTVTSLNLTPDVTGIEGWTPDQVRTLILTGVDNAGVPICPPMPVGPNGPFGKMDPEEALDIGYYLTNLPPASNHPADAGVFPMCVPGARPAKPPRPTTDASLPKDASKG